MGRIVFIVAFLMLFITSCKVTEKKLAGLYKLDQIPKTTIRINADHTFEFSRNNRNQYLHPFDHPDEYFCNSKGTWQIVGKRTISLTSQTDTIVYPLAEIDTLPARNKELSYFTFYDTYGDSVKILYVQLNDSTVVSAGHRSMAFYREDLTTEDSFEFHFYGYMPYTFINTQKLNKDFNIVLKPVFRPGFFKQWVFKLKNNQLIDVKRKRKFKRDENGIN